MPYTAAVPFFVLVLAALIGLGCLSGQAFAFHSGGAGQCEGCHTMHNSFEGAAVHRGLPQFAAGPYLLLGSDQSSVCLNCHQQAGVLGPEGYLVSTALSDLPAGMPPRQLTPGGDFGWLRKDFAWVSTLGARQVSPGDRHGHNIISLDYGYTQDATLTEAPGGIYSAAQMQCTSCHDPHGSYRRNSDGSVARSGTPIGGSGSYDTSPNPGNFISVGVYRLLGGLGYAPSSYTLVPFVFPPPAAVAPTSYNRKETFFQTRVAYGSGMSEWCANCHFAIHNDHNQEVRGHPVGNGADLGAAVAANYNSYIKTGDITGTKATAYLSLVPFEEGIGLTHSLHDYTLLKVHAKSDNSYLQGPESTANVSCLSCHRGHASAWDSILRFPVGAAFMTGADPATGQPLYPGIDSTFANPDMAQGRSLAEHRQAAYDRLPTAFAPFQRVLCNKCHVMD